MYLGTWYSFFDMDELKWHWKWVREKEREKVAGQNIPSKWTIERLVVLIIVEGKPTNNNHNHVNFWGLQNSCDVIIIFIT